jgi:hypothetical protein
MFPIHLSQDNHWSRYLSLRVEARFCKREMGPRLYPYQIKLGLTNHAQ